MATIARSFRPPRALVTLAAAGVLFLLLAGTVWAHQQPAAELQQEQRSFIEIYVLGGGIIGFLIILMSVAMVALIIEHFVTIQRDKLVPPEIIVELEQLIGEEQYEEALNLCEASRNYLTNVVGAALQRAGEGFEPMYSAMETAVEEENLKLMQKITWLNLIGNIGPMMGLFGTVVGMVQAFTKIAYVANPTPQELAAGIYTALITTVWGLVVAIPSLSFYFIFRNKIQRLSFELASVATELVERFKPVAEGGK